MILEPADALEPAATGILAGATRSTVVVFAGPEGSGKTTLAASLYEGFRSGEYQPFSFAGSRTLVGWERRCHLSRVASNLLDADTARTSRDDTAFLHLDLILPNGNRRRLLFADLSGEHFDDLIRGLEAKAATTLLLRADYVVFCLDGRRLTSATDRHPTVNEMRVLQRLVLERRLVQRFAQLTHVATKWDLVNAAGEEIEVFAQNGLDDLVVAAGQMGRPSKAIRTAARSSNEQVKTRSGLLDLLVTWSVPPQPWVIGDPPQVDRPLTPLEWLGAHA